MKFLQKNCVECNIVFNSPIKEINRGNGKFCSLSCSVKYRRKQEPKPQPNVKCAFCDKQFYKSDSKLALSKSGLYFCSRKHKDAAQRIGGIKEIMPPHYGTSNGLDGYRKLALGHYPNKCNRCGYNKFVQALVVHHKDHNRENNDVSNLEVLCPTCHWEHHLGLT